MGLGLGLTLTLTPTLSLALALALTLTQASSEWAHLRHMALQEAVLACEAVWARRYTPLLLCRPACILPRHGHPTLHTNPTH